MYSAKANLRSNIIEKLVTKNIFTLFHWIECKMSNIMRFYYTLLLVIFIIIDIWWSDEKRLFFVLLRMIIVDKRGKESQNVTPPINKTKHKQNIQIQTNQIELLDEAGHILKKRIDIKYSITTCWILLWWFYNLQLTTYRITSYDMLTDLSVIKKIVWTNGKSLVYKSVCSSE